MTYADLLAYAQANEANKKQKASPVAAPTPLAQAGAAPAGPLDPSPVGIGGFLFFPSRWRHLSKPREKNIMLLLQFFYLINPPSVSSAYSLYAPLYNMLITVLHNQKHTFQCFIMSFSPLPPTVPFEHKHLYRRLCRIDFWRPRSLPAQSLFRSP